ncbi:uncharacterized protein TRIADDRAFT_34116 [Trichoplax adhaerens]|uniref:DNA polymerase n=1 Tax=Trichoplax adhaerens TaxID=10228 RepID=B3SDS1_TRIAD|nr:hypothetical protein TRIADDRAFT_34116 [Trichoplax adhaerens]EDV19123.1 hypothetical protein TRIADDRAFT_34116 [Trichoplax adhaerens]|eukprot:XP_002118384.1 hypothetical protein TRIADDRAFT_34116 [Trichoplax adhaerens]
MYSWDPDILIGYEIQMLSWGYVFDRAKFLKIGLAPRLSRIPEQKIRSQIELTDNSLARYKTDLFVIGRILLNVWRIVRSEVTLNIYTFENVSYHVLHQRVPHYSFETLTEYFNQDSHRWKTIEYYLMRCRSNFLLLNELDTVGLTSEFARLFGIPFYSVLSRGSQFRVESMMLRIAKPMNYIAVSPSPDQRAMMRAPEVISLILEPESRFYSDPVVVLDFQSLYPSIIIAYNYCFSTCLGNVKNIITDESRQFGCTTLRVPLATMKKIKEDYTVSPTGLAFVKSNIRKGVLPRMLEEILNTRVMVKGAMKKNKGDKALERLLNARQLGLKLISNVTYGYTSANFSGRMPCVEIGDSIVAKARETLTRAIHLVENTPEWKAKVVYGDTDSMFILLEGATKDEAFRIGREITKRVTELNPVPVKLKFEKVYLPCVLQTKKRYVGFAYEKEDQFEPIYDAKGIETVRRDGCPAVAKILEKSIKMLFMQRDVSLIKKFVLRQCQKLIDGKASTKDFVIAKEYRGRSSYKPGACVPSLEISKKLLATDKRAEPRVGERVPYVVVYGMPGLPLIRLVRRPIEFLSDPSLRLNAAYYITKQILPPLNRIFSLIGVDTNAWYNELPRSLRSAAFVPQSNDLIQKATISQYFNSLRCPICEIVTNHGICCKCQSDPQKAILLIQDRLRLMERAHCKMKELCYQCIGVRLCDVQCESLDCPILFKVLKAKHELVQASHLRKVIEVFSSRS